MAATLTLEVAPRKAPAAPGLLKETTKELSLGSCWEPGWEAPVPLLQGGLNPGLGEWTWVLARDVEAGRSKGLQFSKGPLKRTQPQRPHPAPRIPV